MQDRDLKTVLQLRRAVVISLLERMIERRNDADFEPCDDSRYHQLCDEERTLLRGIRDQESHYPLG